MRVLAAAFLFILLSSAPAFTVSAPALTSGSIKVLILQESFKDQPGEGEKLTLLERANGDLIIGETTYSGKLEVWMGEKGIYLINELPLEDYVEGVVKAETAEDWHFEALKAQAVVVRTYIIDKLLRRGNEKFDVTSSVLDQLYRGRNADSIVAKAVRETKGQVLTYDGSPITAYYHSTCGGRTETPEEAFGRGYPYLKSLSTSCTLSPLSVWARRIPLKELERVTGIRQIEGVRVASRTPTGRAGEIEVRSNPSTTTVQAKELRKSLGWLRLPSTHFTLRLDGDTVVFDGKGYGHGVGLCQWSALEMALEGKGYREILAFFYPGTSLEHYED
jgi:stage II sporulation protein D